MTLQPFGPVMPVHQQHAPHTRIGWVPVPKIRSMMPGGISFQAGHRSTDLLTGLATDPPVVRAAIKKLTVGDGNDRETRFVVVNDQNQPLELWRKVPGFIVQK